MARLGQMLLGERLINQDQLEEALETQVVHGGRLGTNLVELGFLKEGDLARVLGAQHHLPYASGEMIPDPAAMALASRQFYDDEDILPMRVDATRLTVAVLGTNQIKALDALSFKVSKRVVAVVIPEFRMHQLLRLHCKAFRPMRPIDVQSLRPSKRQPEAPARGEFAAKSDSADLINEDDFAKIYANAVDGRAAEAEEEVIQGEILEAEVPEPVPSAPIPPGMSGPAKAPELPALSFAEAQARLQSSVSREDIAATILQFARSKFVRALLLNVQGDLVTGWKGLGPQVTVQSVRRIGVSLREPNTFKLVRDLKSHFVGPMKQTPGMAVFYELLGGGFPKTAVLLPLLVRGKLVHLLYVDHGPQQLTPPDVGELLILSQSVTRSYETLIRQRKAQTMA